MLHAPSSTLFMNTTNDSTPTAPAALYEQLPNESNPAFEAFKAYLKLGPQRSLNAAALKTGARPGTLKAWSSRYQWRARVRAYHSHLDHVEREALEEERRQKAFVWEKHQQKLRETQWGLHEQAIELAKKELATLLDAAEKPASLAGIARLMEVASKLGSLATKLEKSEAEPVIQPAGPSKEFLDALEKVYGSQALAPANPSLPPTTQTPAGHEPN